MSWLAVSGAPRDEALEILGLRDTGEPVLPLEVELALGTLGTGALVFVFDRFWHPLVKPWWSRAALSQFGPVVGCAEEDHVGAAVAFAFHRGHQLWQVSHVRDEGPDHLEIEGTPPSNTQALLAQLRATREREQFDALFDLPAKLAHQMCGFRLTDHARMRFVRLERRADFDASKLALVADLGAGAEAVLLDQGFVRDDDSRGYIRRNATGRITCHCQRQAQDVGCSFDLHFAIHNDAVFAIQKQALDREPRRTAEVSLSKVRATPDRVFSRRQADAVLARLGGEVAALLQLLEDVQALERIVNDGAPPRSFTGAETYYDTWTEYSRITLAWLAANPRFDAMVAATDRATRGGPSPDTSARVLERYLRAHVPPLVQGRC